jgi:hypothetical protein
MKVLIIISILAYNGSDMTKCKAVDVKTKRTYTVWLTEGCIMEGDTIMLDK